MLQIPTPAHGTVHATVAGFVTARLLEPLLTGASKGPGALASTFSVCRRPEDPPWRRQLGFRHLGAVLGLVLRSRP